MNETQASYHTPVMLQESVGGLALREGGVYVDATFGGGGHSAEILRQLPRGARLYGFDQDADAVANVERMMEQCPDGKGGQFTFVRSNFRYLANWMRYYGHDHIDGLIADLGVSSHHLDDERRGFSFRFDAPLDMRMNRSSAVSAADVVNTYDEQRLADVLYLYGELKNSRRIAAAIVARRKLRPIATTTDLCDVCATQLMAARQKKDMARLFQALRIEVNHEMEALRHMLRAATALLTEGGRLVVISYHSLEDRMVKNFIRSGNAEGRAEHDFYGRMASPYKAVSSKPILPSPAELEANPRSRSAKLRIAERRG